MLRMLSLTLLVSFSAALLGCAGSSAPSPAQTSAQRASELLSQLPALPAPHSASVLMSFTQTGSQAVLRDPAATDELTGLLLPAPAGTLSWAIWGFASAKDAVECVVDYTGDAGAEAYFAISDYSRGKWELGGPVPGPQQTLTINDPKYSDGAGNLYIAVIAYDGAQIHVSQLALTADVAPVSSEIDFSGGYTSLAMVDGMPAISYYDDVQHDLRYVRASTWFGSAWDSALTLDSTGDTGRFTSLDVINGNPAIAYYDTTAKLLRYVRALDSTGALWGVPVTVASAVSTGEYCSLEEVAGAPAISYYDFDNGELRYVRALDADGATWGAPVVPDSDGNTGFYSSLKVVDGFPAISYRNGSASQLMYVRAADATGSTWGTPVMVTGDGNAGNFSSLAVVNGTPAIAYYASSMGDLMYVHATEAQGGIWGAPVQLDDAEDKGSYCSLAVVGGVPAVSYHCGLHGDLRFIRALDADGNTWDAEQLLDESSVITGRDTSLCDVYGVPGVSYFDLSNGKLHFMWGF